MVEALTEKTLELEERVNELQEEKSDLVSTSSRYIYDFL